MFTLARTAALVAVVCTMGNGFSKPCEAFGAQPEDRPCRSETQRPAASGKPSSVNATGRAPSPITNSIGIKLVLIPPGEFMMGSRESADELLKAFRKRDCLASSDQFPRHRVRITKGFYLGAQMWFHYSATDCIGFRVARELCEDVEVDTATGKTRRGVYPAAPWYVGNFKVKCSDLPDVTPQDYWGTGESGG